MQQLASPALKAPVMSLNGSGSPAVKNIVKQPLKINVIYIFEWHLVLA
jgi:hypothetical protein